MEPLRLVEPVQEEAVRCLECAQAYSKPCSGGTLSTNPGCPHCGYLGWAPLAPVTEASRRVRYGAGHPPHLFARRR